MSLFTIALMLITYLLGASLFGRATHHHKLCCQGHLGHPFNKPIKSVEYTRHILNVFPNCDISVIKKKKENISHPPLTSLHYDWIIAIYKPPGSDSWFQSLHMNATLYVCKQLNIIVCTWQFWHIIEECTEWVCTDSGMWHCHRWKYWS